MEKLIKYLVFGGSGFIGTHLCSYLHNNCNCEIYNIDLHGPTSNSYCDHYLKYDIRREITFDSDTKESFIYNLAAIHKTPGHKEQEYFETNILGAKNVCNFARKHYIKTIVFTSSIAPYGASEELKTEESLPIPNTPYGISKIIAEYIHKVWQAESPDRRLIIVRPGVVFGKFEDGNFTRLYKSLKSGIFIYPGRKNTRKASIYVKDLVRIMQEMVENEPPGVHLYNMCYPEPHTIKQIVETMAEVISVRKYRFMFPPLALNLASYILKAYSSITGKNVMGIHPDRIRKLMVSTNISGKKLEDSGYRFEYSLKEAVEDWYNGCDRKGLF